MFLRTFRNGSALITCMLVIAIVSTMAVAMAGISGANLKIADNQREGNRAFANAESGLEVMRYWLSRVRIPSSTPESEYLTTVIAHVQADLLANAAESLAVNSDGSIPPVVFDPMTGQFFRGQWSTHTSDPKILKIAVTGASGTASRTVTVNYRIEPYRFPIFNYGMATKGPLVLSRNAGFAAATLGWEADLYVESASSLIAVDIGMHADFAGDIDIGNPNANISGDATVAGGVENLESEDRPEFPVPDVNDFRQYATGPVIDSGSDLSTSTLTNAVIAAGTNPTFTAANLAIQGILFIEAPNVVTFQKNVTLQGMIVADGDVDSPGTNQINIGDPSDPKIPSNFSSGPYPAGAEFDALRQKEGSCVLAPGFKVAFWKNFSAINGVIAASGLYFDKNSNAAVKGTLINYSDEPLVVGNNINFTFDRSAMVEIPAGFDLLRVLTYDPASYAMAF